MSGRHARIPEPPSTSGTLRERAMRRPARVAIIATMGFALAAPMVAAEPVAAPPSTALARLDASIAELRLASADLSEVRSATPGEGPVNTVGLATVLAATHSSNQADATASFIGASVIAEREAAARAAVEKAEAERRAEREAAERAAETARAEAEAAAPAAAAPAVPAGSAWDRLAQCESGGNWGINTGNGYFGGLQFSLSSWRGVGGAGYPHEASRETQIAMGERLRAQGGWGHWPACSRKVGLR